MGENKGVNDTTNGIQKAIVLWLSGLRLTDIHALPEAKKLMGSGAMVELDASPITGLQNQHYKVLSGKDPSSFGYFDTIVPREYKVFEETSGRGATPKLLPDILRTAGWTTNYEETEPEELINCIVHWTQSDSSLPSCLIVKCVIGATSTLSILSEALHIADEWVGETGLLAVLSDSQPANVKQFVNVNNFLAEVGIIERDEGNSQINWPNSLAYFAGHGQLWVNLLGRDAQGAVHPQNDYEEVRDTLVKVLPVKLCDARTGEPVIERVYRKEELYATDYLFCAPDLIVLFKPGYAPSKHSMRIDFDDSTLTTPNPGMTASEGIHPSQLGGFLLVSAPVFARGVVLTEHASLTSVFPTLMHALGVELTDLETAAISALFDPLYLESHPIRSAMEIQELSDEDEELIINRLRDLGYV
jgi:hypothetical protein